MKNINRRGTGIILSYIYTIANTVIGLFLSAYIIGRIGDIENGIYQSMTSFLAYLTVLEFGTGSIMTRNISLCRKGGEGKISIIRNASTIWFISLALTGLIVIAAGVFYCVIPRIYAASMTPQQIDYGKLIFLLMSVRLIFSFLSQALKGCILGFERYSVSQIVNLVQLLVRTVLVIGLLLIYRAALTVVLIDFFLQFFLFLYNLGYCYGKLGIRFQISLFDPQIFRAMTPLALALFLQTIVNTANGNVDKFVISIMMDPVSVSIYSVGMFVFHMFSSLMTIPISMYMPQIAGDMREGKRDAALMQTLVEPCRLAALVGGTVLFGFAAVGKPFINVLYGADYRDAWLIALLVIAPSYIKMTTGVLVNVLDVLRKRHIRSLCLTGSTLANIVLTVWWVSSGKMIGAALATLVATLIGDVIVMNLYYTKAIKINIPVLLRKSYHGILLSLILSGIIAYLVSGLFEHQILALLIGGASFLVTEWIALLIFGLSQEEKQAVWRILNRLKQRFSPTREKDSLHGG